MVVYLLKYYLDFVLMNLYIVKYYLDSKLGKLPILCIVTVNMETSISKLGRVLFRNNSYVILLFLLNHLEKCCLLYCVTV